MSSSCQDNSYTLPNNCMVTMAVKKCLSDGSQNVFGPQTNTPSPTNGVTWVFFPKTPYNCRGLNFNTNIWVGFSKNGFNTIKHTQSCNTFPSPSTVAHPCSELGFRASNSCSRSDSFSASNTCSTCPTNSQNRVSGASCPTTASGYNVNIEFKTGVADTVSVDSCPNPSSIFLNVDNRDLYHAGNDAHDGDPDGLDFTFPECSTDTRNNLSSNVVYSNVDQAVVTAYRKSGFSHPCSTEAMTPSQKTNHLFNQTTEYIRQNPSRCPPSVTPDCSTIFSSSVCDNSSDCSHSSCSDSISPPISNRRCHCKSCRLF